jgi:hypothetical protein
MIQLQEITKYFKSKSYQVNELTGQDTLIITSQEGNQLVLPLKKNYCNFFLYLHFQLNKDFFKAPFNWKIELYKMLLHIELNRKTNQKK